MFGYLEKDFIFLFKKEAVIINLHFRSIGYFALSEWNDRPVDGPKSAPIKEEE